MESLIGKTPFLRLLLPIVAGIAAGFLFPCILPISLPVALCGLLLMLLSFFVRPVDRYKLRWVFGCGVFLFLFSLSLHRVSRHEQSVRLTPPGYGKYDVGTVLDIPEVKPRSIAVNVTTAFPGQKKVILYLEQTDEARGLVPGDEIIFLSAIEPFRNFGNPGDFDYAGYMHNKGFAGSGYVTEANWRKTGRQSNRLAFVAQRCRAKALDFYRSFGLESDAYAFICALTLGYKGHLSNDMQEAFRASGTAHILALSGLHVGIIYAVIGLLFSFFGKSRQGLLLRQWLAIIALWAFVFIVGMSPSVVRAAIMLTLFSFGYMYHYSGFAFNTLAAAAFFILLYRPASLLDVGFQMSFSAVFAILYLNPKLSRLYQPPNKIAEYIWNLFCITTTAQIGVFPLVLYHFGTFPTYFFLTNLLVVPLTGIIIYAAFPLVIFGLLSFLPWNPISVLYSFFQWVEKGLIELLLKVVYISESIPLAQITGKEISFAQLVLLFILIYSFVRLLSSHRARPLIVSLAAVLCFQLTIIHKKMNRPLPQLTVLNSPGRSEITIWHNQKNHYLEIAENNIIPHPEKRILLLSENIPTSFYADKQLTVDILILSQNGSFKINQLLKLFHPSTIVLDSSLPRYAAGRIKRECEIEGIEVHDVVQNGAFSVNF